jgi:hypothetical protein
VRWAAHTQAACGYEQSPSVAALYQGFADSAPATVKHTRPLDEKDVIARFQQVRKAGLSEDVRGVPD